MTLQLRLILLIAVLLIIKACSSTETITVGSEARTASEAPQVEETEEEEVEAMDPVTQLTIGENELIRSMDPLFAHNTTSQRAIYIVYDRLTRIDRNGDVQPSVARSWEVSDDSLTYTFNLRTDAFYHDSSVFTSGLGRVIQANDIKFAFERMAQNNVPQSASAKFTDKVKGFDAFRVQQQNLFFADERIIPGISGIDVVNDSTVSFTLNAPYENFTRLLAHPYASIYPREAAERDRGLHASPLGSGIFTFSHTEGDSVYVFARNESYFNNSLFSSSYQSLRFMSFEDEGRLFRMLSSGDVHFVPETGPQTILSTSTVDGDLKPGYDETLHLASTGMKEIYLYHLPDNFAGIDYKMLENISNVLKSDEFADHFEGKFTVDVHLSEELIEGSTDHQIKAGFIRTPHISYVSQVIGGFLPEDSFLLYPVRSTNRDLSLMFTNSSMNPRYGVKVATIRYESFSLMRQDHSGIRVSENPWWFEL